MRLSRRPLSTTALALGLLLGACGGNLEQAAPSPQQPAGAPVPSDALPSPEPPVSAPEPTPDEGLPLPGPPRAVADWTAGIVELEAEELTPERGVPLLHDVRFERHEAYDRVVFDFGFGPRPALHVEYVDRPVRACGSGDIVQLAGDGWLEVRFEPAAAHQEDGSPLGPRSPQTPGLPIVLEAARTCDFEAVVTWVLGVASPERYRVAVTERPVAVVVDLRHPPGGGNAPR